MKEGSQIIGLALRVMILDKQTNGNWEVTRYTREGTRSPPLYRTDSRSKKKNATIQTPPEVLTQ